MHVCVFKYTPYTHKKALDAINRYILILNGLLCYLCNDFKQNVMIHFLNMCDLSV